MFDLVLCITGIKCKSILSQMIFPLYKEKCTSPVNVHKRNIKEHCKFRHFKFHTVQAGVVEGKRKYKLTRGCTDRVM
jgi:hypothetical protein